MDKKRIITTLVLVLVAFVAGYFIGDSSAVNRMNEGIELELSSKDDSSKKSSNDAQEDVSLEKELPFELEDIAPEITIREPDSIGNVYLDATVTNNTEYPITSYSAKVLLKDSNETAYLSTHDTIMPGDTSPKFNGFGPKTENEEDYEILTIELRAKSEDDKILKVEYDLKLNRVEWSEYDD